MNVTCGACLEEYDRVRQLPFCPHQRRGRRTQVERLVAYIRANPGVTGLEIIQALSLPKYTSRVSDARAQGIDIVCERRSDGEFGYRVRQRVTTGEAVALPW
jgi:hypothetical protein